MNRLRPCSPSFRSRCSLCRQPLRAGRDYRDRAGVGSALAANLDTDADGRINESVERAFLIVLGTPQRAEHLTVPGSRSGTVVPAPIGSRVDGRGVVDLDQSEAQERAQKPYERAIELILALIGQRRAAPPTRSSGREDVPSRSGEAKSESRVRLAFSASRTVTSPGPGSRVIGPPSARWISSMPTSVSSLSVTSEIRSSPRPHPAPRVRKSVVVRRSRWKPIE